jgi:D-3-phosphoglycerate dehydrogenase
MSKKKWKIMVTTHPFGSKNDLPIKHLEDYEVHYNDVGRKYKIEEVAERIREFQPDILVAGTERYDIEMLDLVPNLRMISRVGIGLDSVPLEECKKRGIVVSYTPDAPSNSVAELTICQMINMLRYVQNVDADMREQKWNRMIGKEIRDCNVGVIGCGRIGKLVVDKLEGFKPRRIFVNDIVYDKAKGLPRSEYATKMQILSSCDVVTLHIPYNRDNENYLSEAEFDILKKDVKLVNMSRGGVVNEECLYKFLKENPDSAAAVDTFVEEPYEGKLAELSNAYLTPHLGSCSTRSRIDMELGAAEQAVNFIKNKTIVNKVV